MNYVTDQDHFLHLARDSRTTAYVSMSFIVVLWYDYMIHFGEEIELIWVRSRWKGFMKLIYIWNRYISSTYITFLSISQLLPYSSDDLCYLHYKLIVVAAIIVYVVTDFVLILRIWILYDRNRRLKCLFIILFMMEFGSMIVIDSMLLETNALTMHTLYPLPGCQIQGHLELGIGTIPPLVVASIMFAMTVYKSVENFRMGIAARMPIMSRFLIDGVFWYFAVAVVLGAGALNWSVGRSTLGDLFITPVIATPIIIVPRVLLNIKELSNKRVHTIEEHSLIVQSAILWGSQPATE